MEGYKASNGVIVLNSADGHTRLIARPEEYQASGQHFTLPSGAADALREFFRAEEDERLGRWRWPENPDYVVYTRPSDDQQGMFGSDIDLVVMRETDGWCKGYVRAEDQGSAPAAHRVKHVLAARAYFDAHPEPKPWHNAVEGDVWLITYNGEQYPAIFQAGRFREHGGSWGADNITDGRKLWPEDAS